MYNGGVSYSTVFVRFQILHTASAASCSDGIKHPKQQQHILEDKDEMVRVATQFKQE